MGNFGPYPAILLYILVMPGQLRAGQGLIQVVRGPGCTVQVPGAPFHALLNHCAQIFSGWKPGGQGDGHQGVEEGREDDLASLCQRSACTVGCLSN